MIGRLIRASMRGLSLRRVVMMAALVATWCVLWGDISAANVLSGALLAAALTTPGLGGALSGSIRPVPLVLLAWIVLVDLVKSTVGVAMEILTPGDRTSESIVAVTVPPEARRHMLFFTAAITLTPGTVVVDVDVDAGTLYVHLLHDTDVAANQADIQRLAELTCAAFPVAPDGPTDLFDTAGEPT